MFYFRSPVKNKTRSSDTVGLASYDGTDILYRIVRLPLAEDGMHMDALLVGITHREAPPRE